MKTITYFDFSSVHLASYFLLGFYENTAAHNYRLDISHRAPPELHSLTLDADWISVNRVPFMAYSYDGPAGNFLFSIDVRDHSGGFDDDPPGYSLPLLENSRYYFKVNYNEEAIAKDAQLRKYAGKIKPLPISTAFGLPWRMRAKLLAPGAVFRPTSVMRRRLRRLTEFPTLNQIREMRQIRRDIDVFYVSLYRSEPKFAEQFERRLEIIRRLRQQTQLNVVAGFAVRDEEIAEKLAGYHMQRMSYRDFMKQQARSKIGVYVRGTHNCLSGKFADLMSLGMPIAGETIYNNTANMYRYDEFGSQFAYDDPQDLVQRVIELLEDPQEMDRLTRLNTATFENHLVPQVVVSKIIEQLEENA